MYFIVQSLARSHLKPKNQVIVLSQQEVRVCYGGHTITAGYR